MLTATDSYDDWDVTHGPSESGLYWTTTNVGEAFPGVLTGDHRVPAGAAAVRVRLRDGAQDSTSPMPA